MTPLESRNSDPINRVRCFSKSALVEEVVESKCKWDLVKIICTQSFNKRVQYGLAFIKLHTADAKECNDNEMTSAPQNLFGKFNIREDSPDSDGESSQSLFSRWKGARNSGDVKGISPVAAPLSGSFVLNRCNFVHLMIWHIYTQLQRLYETLQRRLHSKITHRKLIERQ